MSFGSASYTVLQALSDCKTDQGSLNYRVSAFELYRSTLEKLFGNLRELALAEDPFSCSRCDETNSVPSLAHS